MLRWDSYVNIRHVYKTDVRLLELYTNPETPNTEVYRLERESMIRMLSKGKTLTMYEAGQQYGEGAGTQYPESLTRSRTYPAVSSTDAAQTVTVMDPGSSLSTFDTAPVTSTGGLLDCSYHLGDFQWLPQAANRISGPQPKVPPDCGPSTASITILQNAIVHPSKRLLKGVETVICVATNEQTPLILSTSAIRQPIIQLWKNMKGVAAVAFASI
jgi:hypothetical protein